jgi:opacity protein-like surface antigen
MKTKSVTLVFSILFVFFITIPIHAQNSFQKFNLKLSGGYGIIAGGDMPETTDGVNDVLADLATLEGFAVTDKLENAKWGAEFGGEFIFNINRKFSVSLGMEYIRKATDSIAAIELGSLARLSLEWEPEYTAIPIMFSGYYFIPLGQNTKGYVKAGAGYYFAKIKYTIREEEEVLGITYYEQQDGEAKDNGFGFHGGLGLEYSVAANIALFAEGTGRYVNLNDWDVENRSSSSMGDAVETGKFWYAEEYNEGTNKFYATMQLSEERPDDPSFRNVRKAKISLSGFVLKLGIKISF